jgi:uncharacterized protein (TIGR02246 family)
MKSDEEQIRELVSTWLSATQAGDIDTVLGLMTDDMVFLLPGRPPMRREEFASMSRTQAGPDRPKIEGHSDIKEIRIAGDLAFMWTELSIRMTPPDGGPPMERAGHTLSVLERVNGRWRLARDANMVVPVQRD